MKALFRHLLIASIALMAPPVLAQDDCVEFRDRCVKQNRTSHFIDISSASDDLAGIEQLSWLKAVTLRGKGEESPQVDISALSKLPELVDISLDNVTVLTPEDLLDINISRLTINGGASDLAVLEQLSGLEQLNLYGLNEGKPVKLGGLVNLQRLAVVNTPIANPSDLSNLTNMQSLVLADTGITDLSVIADLDLTGLTLRGDGLRDLSPLHQMKNLQFLSLNSSEFTSLDGLDLGENLEVLSAQSSALQDISGLANAINVKHVNLKGSQALNVDGLENLAQLETLDARETPLNDISGFGAHPKLEKLWLSDTMVEDLSPLSGLGNLKEMSLSRMPAKDLSVLAELDKLGALWLNETKATDLTPLLDMDALEGIAFDGNTVVGKENLRDFVESFGK
ncbi:MAG: leucine-rich repeat domain-containing protein [Paracoccaceae bacterium]